MGRKRTPYTSCMSRELKGRKMSEARFKAAAKKCSREAKKKGR